MRKGEQKLFDEGYRFHSYEYDWDAQREVRRLEDKGYEVALLREKTDTAGLKMFSVWLKPIEGGDERYVNASINTKGDKMKKRAYGGYAPDIEDFVEFDDGCYEAELGNGFYAYIIKNGKQWELRIEQDGNGNVYRHDGFAMMENAYDYLLDFLVQKPLRALGSKRAMKKRAEATCLYRDDFGDGVFGEVFFAPSMDENERYYWSVTYDGNVITDGFCATEEEAFDQLERNVIYASKNAMKKRADNFWEVEPNGVKTVELDDGCKVELMCMWNGVEEWIGYTTFTEDGRKFSDGWARTEEEALADAKDDLNQSFGFHHRQYNRTSSKSRSMRKRIR